MLTHLMLVLTIAGHGVHGYYKGLTRTSKQWNRALSMSFAPTGLLEPYNLLGLQLKNRVVLAPLTRGRAGLSRVPNDYIREYYEQRAGAGLLITEATGISVQGYGWYGAPGIYLPEHAAAWKPVTDAVHKKDAKIFVQLWHMGRQSISAFQENNQPPVAPSAIQITKGNSRNLEQEAVPYELPRALETAEIPKVIQDFVNAAKLAKEAGFDGVELHGANGYLIDTFLQSATNVRTDAYGGSIENRYRFLKEVIEAVGTVYPYSRIGLRISPNGQYGGMGSADNHAQFTYVAQKISEYGLAYLHVMDGLGFGFHNLDKPFTLFDAKKNFHGPVISNIDHSKESGEAVIRSGTADLVAYGRPFISNPDLVERFQNNWPLAPPAPYEDWYGRTPDAKDSLKGYIDYPVYQPPKSA